MTERRIATTLVSAPTGGVSQQPHYLRFPSQCQAQENGWSTPVDGCRKRQPIEHVGCASNLWCVTVRSNPAVDGGTLNINFGNYNYAFTYAAAPPADIPPQVFFYAIGGTVDVTAANLVTQINAAGIPDVFAYSTAPGVPSILAGIGVQVWIWSPRKTAFYLTTANADIATKFAVGLATHGARPLDHWIWRDANEKYLLRIGDRDLLGMNLRTGDALPVIPKGGSGHPSDFSYFSCQRPAGPLVDDASGAGLSTGGGAGKVGGATSTAVAPLKLVGPYGGTKYDPTTHAYAGDLTSAQLQATCGPGAGDWFFPWITPQYTGGGNMVAQLGWNGLVLYTRQSDWDASNDIGLGVYDETATTFLGRVKWAWSGRRLLSLTATVVSGSARKINAEATDLGSGWYRILLSINLIASQVGHTLSMGPYLDKESIATVKKVFINGIRFFQGTKTNPGLLYTPLEAMRAITVNDVTILANSKKTTAMSTARISSNPWLITLGDHVNATKVQDDALITIPRSDGVTKDFQFKAGPVADADPHFFIDKSAFADNKALAGELANKINKAFANTSAYAILQDGTGNTGQVFYIDPTYGVSLSPGITDSGDIGNRIGIFANAREVYFPLKNDSYDMSFWCHFRQLVSTTTFSVRAAAVTNIQLNGAAGGVKKCVNGTDTTNANLCSLSNNKKGVFIDVGDKTLTIGTDDAAESLRGRLNTALVAVADVEAGTAVAGLAVTGPTAIGGTSLYLNAETMVDRSGSVLRVTSKSEMDDLDTVDSFGNTALGKVYKQIRRISDAPPAAQAYSRLKVTGDSRTGADDSFVKAITANLANFGPVDDWVESCDYGIQIAFDATTMPLKVSRLQDSNTGTVSGLKNGLYFELDFIAWTERGIGDDTTNAAPSFIGHTIKDMKYERGRLLFLTEDKIVESETNRLFNFWRTTTVTLLDSDPIDARDQAQTGASDQKPAFLNWAVPFADRDLLFTEFAIFSAEGNPILSPRTLSVKVAETIDNSTLCAPVAYRRSAFFAQDRGDFSAVYEISQSGEGFSQSSVNITSQVPRYIPGRIARLAISSAESVLTALCEGQRNAIFVYNWEDNANQRIQSAWYRFSVEGTGVIVSGNGFVDSELFLLVSRLEGWTVEKIVLRQVTTDPGANWMCHLDRRVSSATEGFEQNLGTGPDTGLTVFRLPYFTTVGEVYFIVRKTSTDPLNPAGIFLGQAVGDGTNTLKIAGAFDTEDVWIGVAFPFRYFPTIPMLREPGRGALAGMLVGRLQLQHVWVAYMDTTYLEVRYTPRGGNEKIIGLLSTADEYKRAADEVTQLATTDPIKLRGRRSVPIDMIADQAQLLSIASDSHYDCAFSKLEFDAIYEPLETERIPT